VLAKVASDCGIVLGKNIEKVDANIDLIKAKEIVQATLFAADKKKGETQNVEELFTEEETEIEHNEAHARFLQELEVFDPLEEVAEELEMINKGLSVHIPDKPK
jgi:rubrerythrin